MNKCTEVSKVKQLLYSSAFERSESKHSPAKTQQILSLCPPLLLPLLLLLLALPLLPHTASRPLRHLLAPQIILSCQLASSLLSPRLSQPCPSLFPFTIGWVSFFCCWRQPMAVTSSVASFSLHQSTPSGGRRPARSATRRWCRSASHPPHTHRDGRTECSHPALPRSLAES